MKIRTTALLFLLTLSAALRSQAADLWQPIGPGGGRPAGAVADPFVPGRVFAIWEGSTRAEVYRRELGAAAWSFAGRGLENGNPSRLVVHPAQPGTLWAAGSLPALEIYRSTDAGASWQRRFRSAGPDLLFGLWAVRSGKTAALLGWFGRILPNARFLRSRDGGLSWTELPDVQGPAAVLAGTSTVFALGSDRRALLESSDAGATWTPRGVLPVDADNDALYAFVAAPGKRPVLLAAFSLAGLFRSADRGRTWSRVGPAGPGPASLAVTSSGVFGAFDDGLQQSLDGGATWHPRPAAGYPPGVVTLTADPASGVLLALSGEHSILAQSRNNGRTWTRLPPRGVLQFQARDFAWHPLDARIQALLRGADLLWSGDDGATWRGAPFQAFTFDPADPSVLYGGKTGGIFVTRDGARTWTLLLDKATATLAHSGAALFAGGCGISRSTDDGAHWTDALPCVAPPSPASPSGGNLFAQRVVVHPTDPNVVWAEVFESFRGDDHPETDTFLYGSFDDGLTWQRRERLAPRVVPVPGRPDSLWDLGGFVLHRSDDRGLTWRLVPVAGQFSDLAYDPLDPDHLVAVGDRAIESRNGGATWKTAFNLNELAASWGNNHKLLARVFLHPELPGRIAVAPRGGGLLLRRKPL